MAGVDAPLPVQDLAAKPASDPVGLPPALPGGNPAATAQAAAAIGADAIGTDASIAVAAATPTTPLIPPLQAARLHTAAAAPAAAVDAPGPARQVSAALVQVSHRPGGLQHVTVRLDPKELGQVHVRIERAADGTTTVRVTAERPETLHLLQADKPQLQASLATAGVPPSSPVSFALGTQDSGGAPDASSGGGSNPGSGHFRQPGQPGLPAVMATDAIPSGWQRAGVDIIA